MTSVHTHYEILAYDGHRWALIEVAQSEASAIKIAKAARMNGRKRAVKVLREKHDDLGHEIQTIQVFYDGMKVDADHGQSNAKPRPVNCWKAGDLYSYEGRRTITVLLARSLQQWQITPSELLHHPEYYRRLDNEGSALQKAVQRIAIEQVEALAIPVQERMRQIYDIISQAVGLLSAAWKRNTVPTIEPGHVAQALHGIEHENDRGFLLLAGLSEQLRRLDTLTDKAQFMLTVLEEELPVWAVRALDPLLAEIFAGPAQLNLLFPHADNAAERLRELQALRAGHGKDCAVRIADYIRAGHLIEMCLMLERAAVRHIAAVEALSDGAMLNELHAMQHVKGAFDDELAKDTDFAWKLGKAFSERSDRTMTAQAISSYLSDTDDPLLRAERLIRLEPLAIGRPSHRQIVNFLMPILTSPPNQTAMITATGKVVQRLLRLATLQREIEVAEFEDTEKNRMVRELDQIAYRLMKEHGVLSRIEEAPQPQWQRALKLLELTADGYFCHGMCSELARSKLRQLLKGSNLLNNIMQNAPNETEKTSSLLHLMRLLQAAGINECGEQLEKPAAGSEEQP